LDGSFNVMGGIVEGDFDASALPDQLTVASHGASCTW
jgi:hypothetical protein